MTELLYMKDCYIKEFDANIIENSNEFVVLDKTAFYPEGGGQLSDNGTLNNIEVIKVKKEDGKIKHYIKEPIKEKKVHGIIDWNKRYRFMRMHSAQHLLSSIILDKYNASTVGNQITYERSRLDFFPFKPTNEDLDFIEKEFNKFIDKKIEIKIYFTTRETVLKEIDEKRRNLFSRIPEIVKEIRVIEIKNIDKCPCAGTHIKNTSEIGYIKNIKTENKGKDTTRLSFELK